MTSYLKNQLFSPLGILFGDGNMLYLRPRELVEVNNLDMDDANLKNMLSKGYVAIRGGEITVNIQASEENRIEVTTRPETDDISSEEVDEPPHNSVD
jgi:hypothetical protein